MKFSFNIMAGLRRNWPLWLIILAGALLRFTNLMHGGSFHPDERHIMMVTERLSLDDMNPHFFAYGSFPFYLLWIVAELLSFISPWLGSYDGLFLVGRTIAALCGLLGVVLTYRLALAAGGERWVANLAAAFLSFNVFHLQLSRYYTVDIVLTTIILAALLAMIRVAGTGSWRAHLAAGVLFGLALATKISALVLIVPLGCALIARQIREGRFPGGRSVAQALAVLLLAAVTFYVVAPYSIHDWQTFIANNREQIHMTRGLWRPPYTVQYAGTAPFVYPIQQMYDFTMGAPLALLAFGGFLFLLLKQFRRPVPAEIIILAAIVPMFFAVAGLVVKFPRYLLPIYPLLFVCGALAAREAWRRLPRILSLLPLTFIVGAVVTYAFAFTNVYRHPHVYEQASVWIFDNAPRGSKILGVHWDDKLPLHLPGGLDPRLYRFMYEGPEWELPLYEPDSPRKLQMMSERLAAADYLVFPTQRTYGSIPRIGDELGETVNLLTALFAGELGYRLERSFKVRPRIGSLVFADDTADESFTVYDHPKVLIFRNEGRLTAEEITRRVGESGPPLPLAEFLKRDAPESTSEREQPATLLGLLGWLVVIQIISLASAPMIARMLPGAPDRGYGLSKVVGLLLFGYLLWAAGWYGGVPTSAEVGRWALLAWVVLGLAVLRRGWGSWGEFLHSIRPHARNVEILFLTGFGFFLICRFLSPEIFWGEKPMDFTFLNYFIRLETLPPQDPWAAGRPMGYYYLGVWLIALLHKLSGIDSAIGYNVAMATIGGWLLAAAYSLIVWFVRSGRAAMAGAVAIILLSNWEVMNLVLFSERAVNFDLFWASSRVLASPAITEYPIWSMLFGDLHAHVIAIPFVIALLAVVIMLIDDRPGSAEPDWLHATLLGVLLGSTFALNTWDFISGSMIVGAVFLFRLGRAVHGGTPRWMAVRAMLGEGCAAAIIAAVIVIPFAVTTVSAEQVNWGWVRHEFSTVGHLVRHLGQWLIIIVPTLLASLLMSRSWSGRGSWLGLGFALVAEVIPVGLGLLSYLDGTTGIPWDILVLCALLAGLAALVVVSTDRPLAERVSGLLVLIAALLIAGVETLFLIDRMNTIFKFYTIVWLLLGCAAVTLLPVVWRSLGELPPGLTRRSSRAALAVVAGGAVLIMAAGTIVNVSIMTTFQRVPGPRPTLNGMAFLEQQSRGDARIVEWLRKNVEGTPTILEAHGDSYGAYTRIATYTGLPTVIGWEHHVKQRGTPYAEVERRKRDTRLIYSLTDIGAVMRLLRYYGVEMIVVGTLERQSYPAEGVAKFSSRPDLFPVLVSGREGVLYGVNQEGLP